MLILALESSAKAASVALVRDGQLLSQSFTCTGLTHSRTLLPMTKALLAHSEIGLSDLDAIAVAHGPGSFTGIRIGIATAKGLCWARDIPAIGVSTLESMAWQGVSPAGLPSHLICCAMDARRHQVYFALFRSQDGALQRLCPDCAVDVHEAVQTLPDTCEPIHIYGDGAAIFYEALAQNPGSHPYALAPEPIRMQSAWGVGRAAMEQNPGTAADLLPVYLRLSQAERERLARMHTDK